MMDKERNTVNSMVWVGKNDARKQIRMEKYILKWMSQKHKGNNDLGGVGDVNEATQARRLTKEEYCTKKRAEIEKEKTAIAAEKSVVN